MDSAPSQTVPPNIPWTRRVFRHVGALARNRLVHFIAVGGVIWLAAPRQASPRVIELDADQVQAIWALEARANPGSPLSDQDKQLALARYLEDELFFREGLRMEFDKSDRIVRNRVVQKVMFFAEDMDGASRPTSDEELRAFFERTRDRWTIDTEVRFEQVFVSNLTHANDGAEHALSLRRALLADPSLDPKSVSATFPAMRARSGEWARPRDIRADFGDSVEGELARLPVGSWSQPVVSSRGWHLLRVTERRAGGPARLEDVRPQVVLEYQLERKQNAIATLARKLWKEYSVRVKLPDGKPYVPPERGTRRIAPRGGD